MKRFLSIKYSAASFNMALFILRVGTGVLMFAHGYDKLKNFEQYSSKFINFMNLGAKVSLGLDIFAKFFCSLLLILGLFTRLALIPLMIVMLVAIIHAHNADFFGVGERPTLFFLAFLTIFLVGPGKASIDGMINK